MKRGEGVFLAYSTLVLMATAVMPATSCAPITAGWKASDFRGAYFCDCEKSPGNDTPDCYCRTLAPGVDYRKCSLPDGASVEP